MPSELPAEMPSFAPKDTAAQPCTASEGRVVALLRAGIPLSLLLDLAGGDPHSEELYELERAS